MLERSQADSPRGSLDLGYAGGERLPRDAFLIRGWALFPGSSTARVEVRVDEGEPVRARLGVPRLDVENEPAAACGHGDAAICGFELATPPDELPPGPAELGVTATVTALDGTTFTLGPVTAMLAADEQVSPDELKRADELRRRQRMVTRRPQGSRRLLAATPALWRGGAQRYLFDLLRRLRAAGWDILVTSFVDGVFRERYEEAGIPVHITPFEGMGSVDEYEGRMAELLSWASNERVGAVLANTLGTFRMVDLASRLGVPAVWSIHESMPLPTWWVSLVQGEPGYRYAYERAQHAFRAADVTVYGSSGTRSLFEPCADPARMLTLHYGIDLQEVGAHVDAGGGAELRSRLRLTDEDTLIVSLGRADPRKGQALLARSFAEVAQGHPRAVLALVGGDSSDSYSRLVERYARGLGLADRIRLVPETGNPWEWHDAADLFALFSDIECRPLAIMEAMAFETPVAATRVFGVPDLVEDEVTGWLCEPNDLAAMASILDAALSLDRADRDAAGIQAGRRLRSLPDADAYAADIARLLDALLEDPNVHPATVVSREVVT